MIRSWLFNGVSERKIQLMKDILNNLPPAINDHKLHDEKMNLLNWKEIELKKIIERCLPNFQSLFWQMNQKLQIFFISPKSGTFVNEKDATDWQIQIVSWLINQAMRKVGRSFKVFKILFFARQDPSFFWSMWSILHSSIHESLTVRYDRHSADRTNWMERSYTEWWGK